MTSPERSIDLPDAARAVARTTLYEGYVLWPYRRSAPKNQQRWTFGGVHPREWSDAGHSDDRWTMTTECLVRASATDDDAVEVGPAEVDVGVRFLQVVERRVARVDGAGLTFVDQVEVNGDSWVAWDEAMEREVSLPALELGADVTARAEISIAAATETEWLLDAEGQRAGAIVRSWRALEGELEATCESVGGDAFRVRAVVRNTSDGSSSDRQEVLATTFASTHLVMRARGAAFASLTDPPPDLAAAADACDNEGCWPVLVGERGATDAVLASPIILPDYPVVAPESPGDFFDGGEIDEMLHLHILALTDDEKAEMRATDPRTREMLDRTTGLAEDRVRALHGTFRDGATGDPTTRPPGTQGQGAPVRPPVALNLAADAPDPFWVDMGRAPTSEVVLDGVLLKRGSKVRLHPNPGGDVMDMVLKGKIGIIEGIDEDDQGGMQFTVVIEGDPGLDLGMARFPGHRFYFRPEEIDPIGEEATEAEMGAPEPERPAAGPATPKILVAGIGNIFLGDDGFGVAVARRLASRPVPDGVTVKDFGIRGLDLAYALRDYDTVVFIDAVPRGDEPGTLYIIDASDEDLGPAGLSTHGMDPVSVLSFAREVGPLPAAIYVVGCEPALIPDPEGDTVVGDLSGPVEAAVDEALVQIDALLARLVDEAGAERGAVH